nr:PilX N-terminal domain-containing pilus assembly protein [Reinekea sp. G2M2-21]
MLVALVFLLILTVAGISAMRMSTAEERMTSNFSERNIAFQAAEAALIEAELYLDEQNFQQLNFYTGGACNQQDCFYTEDASGNATCANGLCFLGEFEPANSCVLEPKLNQTDEIYQSAETWRDGSGMHRLATFNAGGLANAKYIIEFRCFAVKDPLNPASDQYDASNEYIPSYWEPLYRITAIGYGRTQNSRVMLQSTYRRD